MATAETVSIRSYSPADSAAVHTLLLADNCSIDGLRLGSCNTFLALSGNSLVGIIHLCRSEDAALLSLLVVRGCCRTQGIGSKLLREMLAQLHEQFVKDIFIYDNPKTNFFEHRGFYRVPFESVPKSLRAIILEPAGHPGWVLRLTLLSRPLYC